MKRTVITLFATLALIFTSFAFSGTAGADGHCGGGTYVPYVGDVGCSTVGSAEGFVQATGDRYDVAKAKAVAFGGAAVESAPAHAAAAAGGHSGGSGGGLAHTGTETTTPVILGAALIAIGGLAVISSKRREIAS